MKNPYHLPQLMDEPNTLQIPLQESLAGKKVNNYPPAAEDSTYWRDKLSQCVISTQGSSLLYTKAYTSKYMKFILQPIFSQQPCCPLINICSAVRRCAILLYLTNSTSPLFQLAADAVKYTSFKKKFWPCYLAAFFKNISPLEFLPAPASDNFSSLPGKRS